MYREDQTACRHIFPLPWEHGIQSVGCEGIVSLTLHPVEWQHCRLCGARRKAPTTKPLRYVLDETGSQLVLKDSAEGELRQR